MMTLALILAVTPTPPIAPVPVFYPPDAGSMVVVSDSSTLASWRVMPNCVADGGAALTYNSSTKTFSCSPIAGGGGGGAFADGGAPANAQYWVGAADGILSAEKDLSALSTGLVINTAGTPSAYAGTSCTNQFPRSLNASGAATCASVNLASDVTGSLPAASVSGAVATATALAADPADCSAGQYATTIAASGALTCAQVAFSQLSGTASTSQLPTVPVTKGGSNLTTVAANQLFVGTGADTFTAKTLPSCSNATTSKLLYDNATQTWSCGTDQTGGGGSGNFVETSLAVDGMGLYSVTVTGQAWVTGTSKIACSPFGTTADGLTPEAVAAAALDVTWSSPVVGTGFTVWVDNPRGLSGTVRIHCTGA